MKLDRLSLAKLMAWFEAAGCHGAVLAGTNGEGPSLSAPEKRDLLGDAAKTCGGLDLILGVSTPSLDEAIWLSKRAEEFGAKAILLMAPSYFRSASMLGVRDWFLRLLDASKCPVLVYNFPKMSGFALDGEFMAALASHPRFLGCKDSSGEIANIVEYPAAVGDGKFLYVGNETLLISALEAGWSGTISGAANIIPHWLARIVSEWFEGGDWRESARTKFEMVLPVLEAVRTPAQPAANKMILQEWGVLDSALPRLPLEPCYEADAIWAALEDRLGITRDNHGLPMAGF